MAGIVLRSIKPKKKIFDLDRFDSESAKALNDTIDMAERDFEKTVSTWKDKPSFTKKKASASKLKAEVYTQHAIYTYVVRGTKAHVITPKRAPVLRFQPGFTPKTFPRRISSSRGSRSGNFVAAKKVFHPGTEARDFDIVIAEQLQPVLVKEAVGAIKKATP